MPLVKIKSQSYILLTADHSSVHIGSNFDDMFFLNCQAKRTKLVLLNGGCMLAIEVFFELPSQQKRKKIFFPLLVCMLLFRVLIIFTDFVAF